MDAAARQLPDEPRIHRAEQQLTALGALLRTGHMVEDPPNFCSREIGVRHKSRDGPNVLRQPVGAQPVAQGGRAAALPDDGRVNGAARGLFPDDGRLALVRDADGGDLRGVDAAARDGLHHDAVLAGV